MQCLPVILGTLAAVWLPYLQSVLLLFVFFCIWFAFNLMATFIFHTLSATCCLLAYVNAIALVFLVWAQPYSCVSSEHTTGTWISWHWGGLMSSVVGSAPPPPFTVSLSLEGQVMEQVKAFNYLGIQIGCPLSFSQNADAVCKKPQHDLLKEI